MSQVVIKTRNIHTLKVRIEGVQAATEQDAARSGVKSKRSLQINGRQVDCTVTPSVRSDRYYRLFYMNDRRVSKKALTGLLLN